MTAPRSPTHWSVAPNRCRPSARACHLRPCFRIWTRIPTTPTTVPITSSSPSVPIGPMPSALRSAQTANMNAMMAMPVAMREAISSRLSTVYATTQVASSAAEPVCSACASDEGGSREASNLGGRGGALGHGCSQTPAPAAPEQGRGPCRSLSERCTSGSRARTRRSQCLSRTRPAARAREGSDQGDELDDSSSPP
jgi:hypothetical protein